MAFAPKKVTFSGTSGLGLQRMIKLMTPVRARGVGTALCLRQLARHPWLQTAHLSPCLSTQQTGPAALPPPQPPPSAVGGSLGALAPPVSVTLAAMCKPL